VCTLLCVCLYLSVFVCVYGLSVCYCTRPAYAARAAARAAARLYAGRRPRPRTIAHTHAIHAHTNTQVQAHAQKRFCAALRVPLRCCFIPVSQRGPGARARARGVDHLQTAARRAKGKGPDGEPAARHGARLRAHRHSAAAGTRRAGAHLVCGGGIAPQRCHDHGRHRAARSTPPDARRPKFAARHTPRAVHRCLGALPRLPKRARVPSQLRRP